jgi:replicative DNA helicase
MSRQQIIYRFISTSSNINANRLKSGKNDAGGMEKPWSVNEDKAGGLPSLQWHNPNLTLIDIRSKLRIFLRKCKWFSY